MVHSKHSLELTWRRNVKINGIFKLNEKNDCEKCSTVSLGFMLLATPQIFLDIDYKFSPLFSII